MNVMTITFACLEHIVKQAIGDGDVKINVWKKIAKSVINHLPSGFAPNVRLDSGDMTVKVIALRIHVLNAIWMTDIVHCARMGYGGKAAICNAMISADVVMLLPDFVNKINAWALLTN
jgi:hypothetical protein